jgi:hypothetical protein
MANAYIHSKNSVRRYGGTVEDYLPLHKKMDCSKGVIADNRHRILSHNMFWIIEVMIPIFGYTITNSDGKEVCVKDLCEEHILEDFGMKFIPTPQDYIEGMEMQDWMQNGVKGMPPSCRKLGINKPKKMKHINFD